MRTFLPAGIWLVCSWSLLLTVSARADDVFYSDLNESSPSGKYQVTAKGPPPAARPTKRGKQSARQPAAPGKFVYVCKDTQTKQTLWTLPRPGGSVDKATVPPPVKLSVSDDGWTVIFTGNSELIPVDLQGDPHGRARLTDAIPLEELNGHIYQTTLGPTWTSRSLWHFLTVENTPYLVVRPWWGHRAAVDLKEGKVVEPVPPAVETVAETDERDQTLRWLREGADSFQTWESGGNPRQALTTMDAAYLAGSLHLTEAIPLLRRLEGSTYNSESALRYIEESERKQHLGEVNPFTHRAYNLRRLVQLSLRRLGETPQPLPCVVLERAGKNYHDRIVYDAPALDAPRADNADKVKAGMKPEAVCELIGVPDYVMGTSWEYDLDAQPPRTLVIQWKDWQATEVTTAEARWKDGSQAEDREF